MNIAALSLGIRSIGISQGGGIVFSSIVLSGNSVPEDSAIGTIVGTLSVLSSIGPPTFTLVNDASGRFSLDGTSLLVAGVLDYEAATSHNITVSATGVLPIPPDVTLTVFVTNILGDPVPPVPAAFSPVSGATGVAVNVIPAITFGVPVRLASGYLYLKKVSDNSVVDIWAATGATIFSAPGHDPAGTVEIVGAQDNHSHSTSGTMFGTVMRLYPNAYISGGTEYYIVWDAGVVRSEFDYFNPVFSSLTAWRFTTSGPAPAVMQLSETSAFSTITNGSVIGHLSVLGGSGTYTYSIAGVDGDPDEIFCVTNENLGNRGNISSASSHRVTIKAVNGIDPPIIQTFTINVITTPVTPVNTTVPVLSSTTAILGDSLTCTSGVWSNLVVSYNYQWMRGGVDIGGATSSSYVVVTADVGTTLTCKVRGVNTGGTSAYTTSSNSCTVGSGLVLDPYTLGAVYSLRKTVTAYAGNCVQIRRSSDSTLQDFGFVSGVVDVSGISAFVGGGTGFVTIWYDQSGNGLNLTNALDGYPPYQPTFIASGINGKPTLRFTNQRLATSSSIEASVFSGSNQTTIMYVFSDAGAGGYLFQWGASASNQIRNGPLSFDFGSDVAGIGGGNVLAATPVNYVNRHHVAELYRTTGGEQGIVVDGVSLVTGIGRDDVVSAGPAPLYIGGQPYLISGDIYEICFLKTDIGAEARAAVRRNMTGYYGTPFPVETFTNLIYSGRDANDTLEDIVGIVPAQFNCMNWSDWNSCTNFYNPPINPPYIYQRLTYSAYVAGPWGSNNSTRFIPTTDAGTHQIAGDNQATLPVSRGPAKFRFAIIAKAAGYDRMVANWNQWADTAAQRLSVGFNLTTGAVGYDNVVGADVTLDAATMTSLGSGWYLCKMDFHYATMVPGNILQPVIQIDNGTGTGARSISFVGNGTSGIDVMWWNVLPLACWTTTWSELFREDWEDLSPVDWENTKADGFKFYVNNKFLESSQPDFWDANIPASDPRWFSIDRPSILKMYSYLKGNNDTGWPSAGWDCQIWTAVDRGGGEVYASFSHLPPLIFERYAHWDTRAASRTQTWLGNINLWSLPLEALDNNLGFAPPGTPQQWMIEWDNIETVSDTGQSSAAAWGYPASSYVYGRGMEVTVVLPLKKFIRQGSIWLRASDTASTHGMFLHTTGGYIHNGFFYGPTIVPYPPSVQPAGHVVGAFTGSDSHHRVLISNGTGNMGDFGNPGQPYYVDWYRALGVAP